jgi:ATP-dependent phosphoenolpyruvate carboxykinase
MKSRSFSAATTGGASTVADCGAADVPGVPPAVLDPRHTWADPAAYDAKARDLAARFAENFKQFADKVDPKVVAAGPKV